MALTINTNISSLMVQLSLKQSSLELDRALEQMTTGYRINSAKDDAAGYAVASKMAIDLSSYSVAQNNAMLGTSLLGTATSSLDLVTTHLQRMRDLAEQAANGTYGNDSIAAIQAEIDQRTAEINRVMSTTEYNGIKLFEAEQPVTDEQVVTGDFITAVTQLSEDEALAQGYTIIKTADDLNNIRNNLSGKYILMNDIDLSSFSNWDPIGDFDTNAGSGDIFTGELNGNGHVIKNLKINRPTGLYLGLFSASFGTIKNLGIENANVSGGKSVGGYEPFVGVLAAVASNVENSYVTGRVSTTGASACGGIIGLLARTDSSGNLIEGGTIKNSYFNGNVSGYIYCGGVVGFGVGPDLASASVIENCFSTGTVSGGIAVGGLTGGSFVYGPYMVVKNSYSSSTVKGTESVGGLAGGLVGTIENSYSTGRVSGTDDVGGLIGGGEDLTVTNCYYDTTTSGQTAGIGGIYNNTVTGNVNGVNTTELNTLIENGTLNKITPIKGQDVSGREFTLQVGIDSTENSKISFDTALGFTLNIDVSTTAAAQNALEQIDLVLDMITAKQTEFGAVQNRLDSVLDSLNVSIQNTTSSLSTIKDADIAKVSADYIRAQILQQASASLLATANQAPSIALNLI